MRYSTDWKDYELIDCSSGEKLERWTREILVRPDPQVIWNKPSLVSAKRKICKVKNRRRSVANVF